MYYVIGLTFIAWSAFFFHAADRSPAKNKLTEESSKVAIFILPLALIYFCFQYFLNQKGSAWLLVSLLFLIGPARAAPGFIRFLAKGASHLEDE